MNKVRPKRFFFHYNKPASLKQNRNVMTIHFEGVCHIAHKVICKVANETHNQKRQPRCIIRGYATSVIFNTIGDKIIANII